MNIARINKATGLVDNIEVWAEVPAETPEHLFVEAGSAGIGWSWDGEALVAPAVPDAPPSRRLIPKSVVQERCAVIGKLDELMAALLAQPLYFSRWFAPNHPNVYFDDADMLTLLNAVGCTEAQIADITA